jgi:hypothetical protein
MTEGEQPPGSSRRLDERVRSDLDLDLVFPALDHTASCPGAQVLYRQLVRPRLAPGGSDIDERLRGRFAEDALLRSAAWRELLRLDCDSDYFLPRLIWQNLPRPPLPLWLVRSLALVSLGFVAAALFVPLLGIGALVLFVVNLLIHFRYEQVFGVQIDVLAGLGRLVRTAAGLRASLGADLPEAAAIERSLDRCRALARKCALVRLPDPTYLLEYVHIVTLGKVRAYSGLHRAIAARQAELACLFRAVGRVDCCLAIASYRRSLSVWCRPELTATGRRLRAVDLRHPALESAVGNDIALDGRSQLVTGCNMSGKSTWLKTVALGALLAQTVDTVAAREYEASCFAIGTLIDVTDDLAQGRSLFAAELDAVERLLVACSAEHPCLCIIDELFRGTNPLERAAAAAAVANYLAERHCVLFATHDLAVQQLVGSTFERVHFTEQHDAGQPRCDYRLRRGLAGSSNALALLERHGLPRQILSSAAANAKRLEGIPETDIEADSDAKRRDRDR